MTSPIKNEDKYLSRISAILFIFAICFNFIGAMVSRGHSQNVCWEIGSLCAVGGYATMAGRLAREEHDLIAAGFNILLVAEGFAIASVADPNRLDAATFGACMALYVPGYLIIGLFSHFKWWVRLTCVLLCIPFGIEAFIIINGSKISFEPLIHGIGYTLQMIAFIGWIIELLKHRSKNNQT